MSYWYKSLQFKERIMLTYINKLEQTLALSNNDAGNNIIKHLLVTEQEACERILNEYNNRERRLNIDCVEICEHEKEIIEQIHFILEHY